MAVYTKNKTVIGKKDVDIQGKTNEHLTIMIQPKRCIVDSHAHIENGSCAPLPLLWDKSWLIRGKTREKIDEMSTKGFTGWLFKLLKGEAGTVQVLSTNEIGNRVVREMNAVFGPYSKISQSDLYLDIDVFYFLVIQMMDMEYAHLGGFKELEDHTLKGFKGHTIYHEDELSWYYYKRKNGKDPEEEGKKIPVPEENIITFSKWGKQLRETIRAIIDNPLRLIGMYHYEPRRWNYSKKDLIFSNSEKGPWTVPFNYIATKSKSGLFVGFKMYPPLGFKPLDDRLPYLHDKQKDGDCFYARCADEGIPILVHCSPGGMYTHEMKFYRENDEKRHPNALGEFPSQKEAYFWRTCVHPSAWRDVLTKFPNLKLCLAHFGGDEWNLTVYDYEESYHGGGRKRTKEFWESKWISEIIDLTEKYVNVYTDFSCWELDDRKDNFINALIQYPHLKQKILFGTDWYMTLVALGGTGYKSFCDNFWNFFMDKHFSKKLNGKELWQRFTFINPFKFYGFDNQSTVDNIADELELWGADSKILKINRTSLQTLIKDFKKICPIIESGG